MAERPVRIAVSGYYGCGNTGDEAVLAGIVESFHQRAPERPVEFTILSADPADTQKRHGLTAIPRMNRTLLAETFRRSDLVLSGGGSLLQDTTSMRSLVYYLWVVRLALRCRVPVMFYAQGIGPLRRRGARAITRMVADRVQRITVRDPESAELLRQIGVTKPPIEVTADPAFALSAASRDDVDSILQDAGCDPAGSFIGVALRPWHVGVDPAAFATVARQIVEQTGHRILFLPMQPPADVELARQVAGPLGADAVVVERQLSPSEAVGVVSRMQALVGMRLHALIFAASRGVPIVGFAYDPKVAQLMELTGQSSRSMPLNEITPIRVAGAVREALSLGEGLRAELTTRSAALREGALKNVDHAFLAIDAGM